MNNLVSEKKKGLTVKLLAILLSIIFLCTIIVPVNITTALAAEGDQDRNFIVVQKTFDGIKEEQIPGKFAISVSNGSNSYTLNKDNAEKSSGLVWRWKVMDAAAGTYNVTESNADIEGYDLSTAGLGSVTVKAAELNVTGIKEKQPVAIQTGRLMKGSFLHQL